MAWIPAAAGVALAAAIGLLGAFFATKNELYDRVAELAFVVFGVTGIGTALMVAGQFPDAGIGIAILTAVGIVGAGAVGLGELGTMLRLVDFRRISMPVTIGFLAFLIWVGVVAVLAIGDDRFPTAFGWLGIGSIAVGVATMLWIVRKPGVVSGDADPGVAMWLFFAPLAGIVAWLAWLGFVIA
jgi:hypothetical protein